ncbi:putative nuclease HARBI1 [Ostrea edulis]|uniref:putative nuclease HARBI1 n=1 Tax=Ostrea edulis TaxID=37623 RepID=UPI0024AF3C49|nr:putative nuclease HARBI1 [Ostrea edulis]
MQTGGSRKPDRTGFPGVVGCTDETIIKIQASKENEADYICQKGYYALNIQYQIIDLVAKWPGSVHDSRIFRESALCTYLEEGQIQGIVLGDSGYGLKPYLMTPYLSAETEATHKFNTAHCRTRVTIEQTYGIKKGSNALHCGLRINPEPACRVVTACVILQNIGLMKGDILTEVPPFTTDSSRAHDVVIPEDAIGRTVRDHIRDTYFHV